MIDPSLQLKYISLLGETLEGFKKLRNSVYNFRCPICGDSKENSHKRRGYILQKNGNFYFYCHNCGISYPFKVFLREVDSRLFKEYQQELLTSGVLQFTKKDAEIHAPVKWEIRKNPLVSVSDLPVDHSAQIYLRYRRLPERYFKYVKWTDNFPELVQNTIGDKYKNAVLPMKGIVFELRELDGKLTGYQIRSIDQNCPKSRRFVICSINDDHGYFYKEKIDTNRRVYVVEGCTDSIFLDNSIAVLNSALHRIHPTDNCVYFNDQEPRNKEVCNHIKKCIDKNYSVVLLPHEFDGMDVNDIVKLGMPCEKLHAFFERYTYSGLKARVQFSNWKK